jgi:hypothetical protein
MPLNVLEIKVEHDIQEMNVLFIVKYIVLKSMYIDFMMNSTRATKNI